MAYDTSHGNAPDPSIRIRPSARKHGIDDARIIHAIGATRVALENPNVPGQLLFLGPDRHGNPLEVIAFEDDAGILWVVHAMRLRSRYAALYREVNGHP